MHKINDISYDKIFDYIDIFNDKENENFKKFRDNCQRDYVPIIKKDVENFLRFYLNIIKPKKILEIGCAVGYSSIFMSNVLNCDVKIDTLEISDEMADIAQNNFEKFGMSNINIIRGDALKTIPNLNSTYDMAFIDASKGHYDEFYNLIQDKMEKKSTIICDNMLFKGYLCMEQSQIPRRFKTIYNNMNLFLENIIKDKSIIYNLLPLGDGLLVIQNNN